MSKNEHFNMKSSSTASTASVEATITPGPRLLPDEPRKMKNENYVWHVVNLYHFVQLNDVPEVRRQIQTKCQDLHLRGSLWIASEGFNGTLASQNSPDPLQNIIRFLETNIIRTKESPTTSTAAEGSSASLLECKFSIATVPPYPRMLVKIKKELVTMGDPSLLSTSCDCERVVGNYVEPKDWNALITSPNVLVIDVRNDYEVELGTFQGAVNPNTKSFSEFPEWWKTQGRDLLQKKEEILVNVSADQATPPATLSTNPSPPPAAVAMFCTGGIRCEKSTHYLLQKRQQALQLLPPNTPVYHLKGGILKYLETVDNPNESTWNGHCFVFDQRVSVTHGLQPGPHTLCYACRRPFLLQSTSLDPIIAPSDSRKGSTDVFALYEPGVSCPRCYHETTDEQKRRFRERQQQKQLASDQTTSNKTKTKGYKTASASTVHLTQNHLQENRDKKRKSNAAFKCSS